MDKKQTPAEKLTKIIRGMSEFNAIALEQAHRELMELTSQAFRLALDEAIKALWKDDILFQVTGKGDSTYIRYEGDEQARRALEQARARVSAAKRKIMRSAVQAGLVQTRDKRLQALAARQADRHDEQAQVLGLSQRRKIY